MQSIDDMEVHRESLGCRADWGATPVRGTRRHPSPWHTRRYVMRKLIVCNLMSLDG